MNHFNPNAASADLHRSVARLPAHGWLRALTALCLAAGSLGAQAQTAQVLKNLVANHGSLAAGDVVFTNFRLPLLQPGQIIPVGDTFPVLYDGADGSVQASVAADGKIKLVLTPIDTATGLPKPYAVNAKPGALLPTDHFRYIEYDVVVTNPQRRLHGVDRAFGPGSTAVMGSIAQNAVMFFDATQPNGYLPAAKAGVEVGIQTQASAAPTSCARFAV